jgi:hypothetical protein
MTFLGSGRISRAELEAILPLRSSRRCAGTHRLSDVASAGLLVHGGELAVLRIVGDEVRQHGQCDHCVDEVAARAGVCRSLAKNAIRTAARLGLVTVEERRREGRRNLPNVIRIVSREWRARLARGPKAIGVKKITPTAKPERTGLSRASEPVFAARGQQAPPVVHNAARPRRR